MTPSQQLRHLTVRDLGYCNTHEYEGVV